MFYSAKYTKCSRILLDFESTKPLKVAIVAIFWLFVSNNSITIEYKAHDIFVGSRIIFNILIEK